MTCPLAQLPHHTCRDHLTCLKATVAALTNHRPRDERRRGN